MNQVEAIYKDGVFKPLKLVPLSDNQKVYLHIQPIVDQEVQAWLEQAQQLQQKIVSARGHFPDSVQDIATDRTR